MEHSRTTCIDRQRRRVRRAPTVPVATRARFALMEHGFTYSAAATRLGVTRQMVFHVVRGNCRTPWLREALARLVNRPVAELWPDEAGPPSAA